MVRVSQLVVIEELKLELEFVVTPLQWVLISIQF